MPTNNNAEINSYLEGLQRTNPSLYNLLRLLSEDLNFVVDTLIPESVVSTLGQINKPAPLAKAVSSFFYDTTPLSVRFNWTTTDVNSVQFEVRKGNTWDTAAFQFRTTALQADINPILAGTTHFIIRSINVDGIISTEELGLDVFIFGPGAVDTLTFTVIDNNILLKWTPPLVPSFNIDYYNIYRNAVLIGKQAGTFFVYFENAPGTFNYNVRPVDIAGNEGPDFIVAITVSEPPDFVLYDSRISTFSGTKVNCIPRGSSGRLLATVNLTETWANHFLTRGWNTIADQVAAGYPIYAQPVPLTGSYVEVIDYGAVLNDIIVSADWITTVIASTIGVTVSFESSLDNITWSAVFPGPSVFFTTFRYIRVTLNFTSDGHGLIEIFNFRILLNVKLVLTSGAVNSLSSDASAATASTHAGGTYVTFTKAYKDVDSITLTVNSRSPITAIFDFIDIPNPDGFKVYALDASGNRVSQTINWKVRGKL